ncbi:MAG TPA: choice-of-anchor tandem repeat GloVer-containing protein [Tepidisphaeraceae bacterium]|nr:choice-of-anchor tandem repeat GloVer-containing protein [Tepidisphaeraceae bacterium]
MKRRTIFSVKPRKAIRTGTARAFCETLERRVLLSGYALSQIGVFGVNASGANPQSTLAVDSIGNLYGTASRGGASGDGTIFEIAKGSGTITTLASFNGTNGANTEAGVTLDASGNLYGTTFNGGSSNAGTVFEIAKGSGTITTLVSFDGSNGANPSAGVTLDAAGDLYGTTDGGGDSNDGTVFEIAKGSGTITTLASFIFANGNAVAGVALDASGNLYGTTYDGGGSGSDGTVFEIAKGSGTIKTIASFNGTNGAGPLAGVTLDASGNLYGTTVDGGDSNDGTVFEIAKGSGTITTLASFNLTNGANPSAGVALDASGNLYGTTNEGTVFKIAKGSGTITTLIANGASILGGVTLDASGNLYGTTDIGGTSNDGTVFEIAKGLSTTRTLASFNGTNGEDPQAGVTLDASGNLYGTTELGGDGNGDGTVFEIAKGSGAVTTLAAFNLANGQNPASELTLDASGNLYGTAINGGSSGDGTVFEIAKGSATIATLASFNGTNGKGPDVGVTLDAAGNLYGTTSGGTETVFEIAKGSGTVTTLASFYGYGLPSEPEAGVTLDASGNLYGTTFMGGSSNAGTVFEIVKGSGTITTLASFNFANGAHPFCAVALDASGNLYGTTNAGGTSNAGTVFEIIKGSSTITTLASFNGANGADSRAAVALDASGNLFGTTYGGGISSAGTVFEIAKGSSTIKTIATFNGTNGANPWAGVTLDASGNLYGTTYFGGANGDGTVFRLTPDVPPTLVGPVAISDSSLTTANQTQRSEVRNLTVTFSQPVTLGGNPFTLQRLNTGGSGANDNSAPTDASAALGTPASSDGGITWSIPVLANTPFSDATGSLRDGTYTLNIHGASVTSTSTGTPMALDSSITFHRLFGDYDGNGIVNNADYRQFVRSFLATRDSPSYSALFDYDGNGTIDLSDYRQFKLRYGKQLM